MSFNIPNTFTAGTKARADKVNENFTSIQDEINKQTENINAVKEDLDYVKKEILDLNPLIFQLILSQVPLKVVKEVIEYPKGDGWEVLKEEDYIKSKSQVTDPRLEKLKEFKIQDD